MNKSSLLNVSPSVSNDYFIRMYRPGDEYRILSLFKLVFKKSMTIEEWKWKYEKNPEGFKIAIAEEKGDIVSHHGMWGRKVSIDGRVLNCTYCGDSITHPVRRQKGLFTKVRTECLQKAAQDGVVFSFGFSSVQALYKKAWFHSRCSSVYIMTKVLNPKAVLRVKLRNKIIETMVFVPFKVLMKIVEWREPPMKAKFKIQSIKRFDERISNFDEKVRRKHRIVGVRNLDYLNWRYFDNPTVSYYVFIATDKYEDIRGLIVLRKIGIMGRNIGIIVDLVVDEFKDDICEALVFESIKYFKENGVDYINAMISNSTSYYQVLRKFGFIPRPYKAHFIVHENVKNKYTSEFVDLKNWHITFGDMDSY